MKRISRPRGLFLVWGVMTLLAAGAAAQTPFGIVIEPVNDAMPGTTVSVPVVKTAGSGSIWGFDFLIVYDTMLFTLAGVTPGEMFNIPGAYEWEYFESRPDTINGYEGYIRAVALANTHTDPHVPLNVAVPDGTTLFTLDFNVSPDTAYHCYYGPIRFYWLDCGDNAMAPDSLGSILAVSDRVYDWYGSYHEISYPGSPFPGEYGVSDSCLTDTTIVRMINFYDGGMDIYCNDIIDNRGDINCNGILNEVADYVMYYNYFMHGLSAFGGLVDCAVDASDVNADGAGLRVEDLIYLYRIVIGDAIPYPSINPHDSIAVTFTQDDDAKMVSLDYSGALAGIHLVFDGEITPTSLINVEGVISDYNYDGEFTRVLISPDLNDFLPSFMTGGVFLTYTGSALLTDAGAADYSDHVFSVNIDNTGSGLTIPYEFEIGRIEASRGQDIAIPVIKSSGSESIAGFDFLIGYNLYALNVTGVTPGILFDTPGGYEWEYFAYRFGPFACADPICPSGLVRVVALAETNNGSHYPLQTEVPNGTVLFTVDCQVATDPAFETLFLPTRFFWLDCGDNAAVIGLSGDSLALSDHVFDFNGFNITDPGYGLPGYFGAPDNCIGGINPPLRFADFKNGGVQVGSIDSMELVVSIDSVSARSGDSAVYIDVYVTNPQDSIAGFALSLQMDNPDLVEFGRSPDDTIAVDVSGSLISSWDLVIQRSLSGTYHDLKIVAISNSMPPFDKAIPPQSGGLLCRLILHVYDDIPPIVTDSTVRLAIVETPSATDFSDPNGVIIGLSGGQYNPQTVSFRDGIVKMESDLLIGDVNSDGRINVGDVVYLIACAFRGGPCPNQGLGDVNCDGVVNVADAVYLINYIFKNGPPPIQAC